MFWKYNTVEKVKIEYPQVPVRPKPKLVVSNDRQNRMSGYDRIADEIGLKSAAIIKDRILRVMTENQIPRYDYAEVYAYLRDIALKQGQVFIWQPLRQQDGENFYLPGYKVDAHGSYYSGGRSYFAYDKAVPIEMLRRVKIIGAAVPEARFFVSNYADPNPDPFIMTVTSDYEIIVFGCWDEPGFFAKE